MLQNVIYSIRQISQLELIPVYLDQFRIRFDCRNTLPSRRRSIPRVRTLCICSANLPECQRPTVFEDIFWFVDVPCTLFLVFFWYFLIIL